jgi:hypothetical protein
MQEDKNFIFEKLGMNTTIPLTHANKSGDDHSSKKDTIKK